jgi:hypothetical protein
MTLYSKGDYNLTKINGYSQWFPSVLPRMLGWRVYVWHGHFLLISFECTISYSICLTPSLDTASLMNRGQQISTHFTSQRRIPFSRYFPTRQTSPTYVNAIASYLPIYRHVKYKTHNCTLYYITGIQDIIYCFVFTEKSDKHVKVMLSL